ncbi:pyruvate kinase [Salipiger pacificus]|nr:pyruvate kinase [Alloyangia pacifica]MCA0948188.1 pyruvate kinase [Alloyangia pacifica]
MNDATRARSEAISDMLKHLEDLRAEICAEAAETTSRWGSALKRPEFRDRMENLALYLALRKRDLTVMQDGLSRLGLSSLGRAEGHVLQSLDAVLAALAALIGERSSTPGGTDTAHFATTAQLERDLILGDEPADRATRILVTLPSEAAREPELISGFIDAGADCLRINCAHDGPEAWCAMAMHARDLARHRGRDVRILMDLAGPKVRTKAIRMPASYLERERKARLKKLKAAGLDPLALGPKLKVGERLRLVRKLPSDSQGVEVTLSHVELLDALRPGVRVWFDDGKLSAMVLEVDAEGANLEIDQAADKGSRLAPEKGVNLPGIALDIPALTEDDFRALDTVSEIADMVGFSFVQTPRDIRDLQEALAARRAASLPPMPIVLKIETDLAVSNLPSLIVQAGGAGPVAVMIARGDLAVEIGLSRLAEIQEEILWVCEAAGVPVIWATQVLETLAKEGLATRAEATDAAMGQRAECVMLNKGPHATEAVAFLAKVLRRMDRHYSKKSPRLGPLRAWHGPQTL